MGDKFVGVTWRKSTRSAVGNCVEVTTAPIDGVVGIRDTKDREGTVLAIPTEAWTTFLAAVKAGALR
jgi:hypothetical protein